MSTRRYIYFNTEATPAVMTPLADRLFDTDGISECDRLVWMGAGFGPYTSTTHIRLNVNVEQATYLRSRGGDSSDFARFIALGGTPTELCEILESQIPSPTPRSSSSQRFGFPSRDDVIHQLIHVPTDRRTDDWSRLLQVISPALAPVVEHLVALHLDTPENLTRCVQIQSSSRFQKFVHLLDNGASLTEADWATHFPRLVHRVAWQITGVSCAEAVQRRTFTHRPLDVHEGADPLDSFFTGRRRTHLYVCAAPFAVWRRDGGYVHPEVVDLLRNNGTDHQRTLDIINHYGYRVHHQFQPDLADFGVGDLAGSSISEYGDPPGSAAILQALLTPQEAANVMRREYGTDAVFRAAFSHPFPNIRSAAATRGSHLPDLMVRASCDQSRDIRSIAASSHFTPTQVLYDLAKDRAQSVRFMAEMNLSDPLTTLVASLNHPAPEAH